MESYDTFIKEIKCRYPSESIEFISSYCGIPHSYIKKVVRQYKLLKLPENDRNYSVEYLSYKHNVDLELLNNSIENVKKYKQPYPDIFSRDLISRLYRLFPTPMSKTSWKYINDNISLHELEYILDNYKKFTNNTIKRDLNIEKTTIITHIAKKYNLKKPERHELYCEICRIENLPTIEYKSNTSCKKCWTKRMSEYQYIYYPLSANRKKK